MITYWACQSPARFEHTTRPKFHLSLRPWAPSYTLAYIFAYYFLQTINSQCSFFYLSPPPLFLTLTSILVLDFMRATCCIMQVQCIDELHITCLLLVQLNHKSTPNKPQPQPVKLLFQVDKDCKRLHSFAIILAATDSLNNP